MLQKVLQNVRVKYSTPFARKKSRLSKSPISDKSPSAVLQCNFFHNQLGFKVSPNPPAKKQYNLQSFGTVSQRTLQLADRPILQFIPHEVRCQIFPASEGGIYELDRREVLECGKALLQHGKGGTLFLFALFGCGGWC